MGKNIRQKLIFLAIILVIFALYFATSKNQDEKNATKKATEAEKILSIDLSTEYPKTPTAVMVLYSRISKALYNGEWDKDTTNALIDEMYQLYATELQVANPKETFQKNFKMEIAGYKDKSKKVMTYRVDGNDNVITTNENSVELANLNVSYSISEKNSHHTMYQNFILKKEADQWRILGWISVSKVKIVED